MHIICFTFRLYLFSRMRLTNFSACYIKSLEANVAENTDLFKKKKNKIMAVMILNSTAFS